LHITDVSTGTSAWEKIYLGWVEPTEISKENNRISLTANLAATLADTVI